MSIPACLNSTVRIAGITYSFFCFIMLLFIIMFNVYSGELFATQGLHQEHEAPQPHRSEDCEEDDGEPQGGLGNETGQFVHKLFCL